MWRRLIISIIMVLMAWFHAGKAADPFLLFFSVPIFLLFLLYFLIAKDRVFVVIGIGFVLLISIYGVAKSENTIYRCSDY